MKRTALKTHGTIERVMDQIHKGNIGPKPVLQDGNWTKVDDKVQGSTTIKNYM